MSAKTVSAEELYQQKLYMQKVRSVTHTYFEKPLA